MAGGNFKRSTAEIISELLSDERVRKGLDYVRSKSSGRSGTASAGCRRPPEERARALPPEEAYPEAAAREELTLRLAEVEAEAAELRIRLSELLEQEGAARRPRGSIELQHLEHGPTQPYFEALYDTSMLLFALSCDLRAVRVKMGPPHPVALQEAAL